LAPFAVGRAAPEMEHLPGPCLMYALHCDPLA
jgi:hypothetical protein